MSMLNFQQPVNETLLFSRRVCKKKHADLSGRSVRRKIRSGGSPCWACVCHLPPGQFEHDFGELEIMIDKRTVYLNDEERRIAHIERQKKWNKSHPETFKKSQAAYAERNKEARKARSREFYQLNREKILARNKEKYHSDNAERRAKAKEYYQRNKEKISAYNKERYDAKKDKDVAI